MKVKNYSTKESKLKQSKEVLQNYGLNESRIVRLINCSGSNFVRQNPGIVTPHSDKKCLVICTGKGTQTRHPNFKPQPINAYFKKTMLSK
jgi:hypothetical protein